MGLDGRCNADCYRVLERISERQSRVHVKILPYPRQGLVTTLNCLLESCDCEYVARQDSDDISLLNRIVQQLKTMQEVKDLDFCGTQILRVMDDLKPIKIQRRYPQHMKSQLVYSSILNNPIAHPTLMIRRESLGNIVYRDYPGMEDWDLYLQLWERGRCSANLDQTGLVYRLHSQQITAGKKDQTLVEECQKRSAFVLSSRHPELGFMKSLGRISGTLNLNGAGNILKHSLERL